MQINDDQFWAGDKSSKILEEKEIQDLMVAIKK